MPILKLKKDDPQRELEFEVLCSLKYSIAQRLHKLLILSERMLKMANKYEDRKTPKIIKRKAD